MKQDSRSQLTSQETAELPGDEAVAGNEEKETVCFLFVLRALSYDRLKQNVNNCNS